MLGPEKLHGIAEQALTYTRADQAEVLIMATSTALTRFANSRIHQNVAERNLQVRVRAVLGKKVGVASVNSLDRSSLQRAAERAVEIAHVQPENPDLQSLPVPLPIPATPEPSSSVANPQQRARAVGTICRLAATHALVASGAYTASQSELLVSNSLGVRAYATRCDNELTTVIMSDDSSGYASSLHLDAAQVNAEAVAQEAVDKALRSRHPIAVPSGDYTVILEEHAVVDLIAYLSYLGFGATAVHEGRSFMAGRFGEKITGEAISVWDDGLDPSGLPMPFDFEGVPKQRVDLIRDGVAVGVVYDTSTAAKDERQSTGHALPAPNSMGPFATNLFMGIGQASKEAMLASIDRGLWVTRFHYVNPVHPLQTILTGMTRDGTFLIENGELTSGVKNLRFTQNMLQALAKTRHVGRTSCLARGFVGGIRAPALCLESFAFTGATEF